MTPSELLVAAADRIRDLAAKGEQLVRVRPELVEEDQK